LDNHGTGNSYDLEIHQMYFKTAFLLRNLFKDVFMMQPHGFQVSRKYMIYKPKKSIYGLKPASRQWYLKFDEVVTFCGFKENIIDQCIDLRVSGRKYTLLVLYVDDILLARNDSELLLETKHIYLLILT
jgi:hypothetical protein